MLHSGAANLSDATKHAIVQVFSEDYCTTRDDRIVQCVYPRKDLCEFSMVRGQVCKERPTTIHCVRPTSDDIRVVASAACFVTRAACEATSGECGAVAYPLRGRLDMLRHDVARGAPTPDALRVATSLYRLPWAVLSGDRNRVNTSFATEAECNRFVETLRGGKHHCMSRPVTLYCRYGAMMVGGSREIDCFPSQAECKDPAPSDTSCVEYPIASREGATAPAGSAGPAAGSHGTDEKAGTNEALHKNAAYGNVSPKDEQCALASFQQGNELLNNGMFPQSRVTAMRCAAGITRRSTTTWRSH
jgi:hypothetical protein